MKINSKKFRPYLILFFILVAAFILRVYKIDQVPPSLYWDEAAIALDAKAIAQTGRDQHGFGWLQAIYPSWGDYKLPGYILSTVPFFWLIKNNPELAVRLPSVLSGTLLVGVMYFLAKELFLPPGITPGIKDRKTPSVEELAALLIALAPINLHFSRVGFEGNLALLFNTLFLLFFLKADKKKHWILPAWICLVFGFFTYYSARYFLPFIAITAYIFLVKDKKKMALFLTGTMLVLGLCVVGYQRDYRAKNADFFRLSTKSIFNNPEPIEKSIVLLTGSTGWLDRLFYHRYLFIAKDFSAHLAQHADLSFLLASYDGNLRHSTGRTGALYWAWVPFFFFGLYRLLVANKRLFLFLLTGYFMAVLPAAATYETPHALRSLNLTPFLLLITAYGLGSMFFIKKTYTKPVLWLTIGLFLFQFTFYLHDYYVHYPVRSGKDWQYGYKQAVEKVNKDYDVADKIYFDELYGRAYIYFLLYSDYSLADYQRSRQAILDKDPLDFRETKQIDKIEFGRYQDKQDEDSKKIVAVGRAEDDSLLLNKEIMYDKTNEPLFLYAKNF